VLILVMNPALQISLRLVAIVLSLAASIASMTYGRSMLAQYSLGRLRTIVRFALAALLVEAIVFVATVVVITGAALAAALLPVAVFYVFLVGYLNWRRFENAVKTETTSN
jgi:hypothetical protein